MWEAEGGLWGEVFIAEEGWAVVGEEKLKAGVVGDAGSQFDIYKDTKGNLWEVKKGGKPEESDLWLDNLKNY